MRYQEKTRNMYVTIVLFNQFRRPLTYRLNCINGPIVRMIASSAVDRGLEHVSGQSKSYANGICGFTTKRAALRS